MSTDVNAAFAAEKRDQLAARRAERDATIQAAADKAAWIDERVAAGILTQISENAYKATQGWDAGEVFTVNRNAATGQITEVIPNHGLDVSASGEVALFTRIPAWHDLGQLARGDETIEEILDLGGIAYDVEKRAARYTFDGESRIDPDHFVTVRADTGAPLGVVGGRYTVIQNRELFTFLEDLVATTDVVWESAGALREGKRVFVSMSVPETVTIDPGGLNDEIKLYVAAMNSHDGRSQAETVLTPWRPVCANTERFALRDARSRWGIRHTSGAFERLAEARRTLGLTVKYAERFAAEETTLARADLAMVDFRALIEDLWPIEENAPARTRTAADKRQSVLGAMFAAESEAVGRTAYAGERALTNYLDHVAPRRPAKNVTEEIARATALLEGVDDPIKTRAHARLMALTR
jgi:phage/plasmid-like protein (TIGR03299 family)